MAYKCHTLLTCLFKEIPKKGSLYSYILSYLFVLTIIRINTFFSTTFLLFGVRTKECKDDFGIDNMFLGARAEIRVILISFVLLWFSYTSSYFLVT